MRILIVGGGAREDALSWRLAASPSCEALFHAPGNAGTSARGVNWDQVSATDARTIARRAQEERVDLVVLGPETAIAAGVGDRCREAGIAVFGPGRNAGRLETSKVFAKRFMERHQIPTARFKVVHNIEQAKRALEHWRGGAVVKADGLASRQGRRRVRRCAARARAADRVVRVQHRPRRRHDVVIEERLSGREVSVFAISDGRAMVPSRRPAIISAPATTTKGRTRAGWVRTRRRRVFPENLLDIVRERVIAPALRGLLAEGEEYRGVLYCGMMMTDNGPFVIEFKRAFR